MSAGPDVVSILNSWWGGGYQYSPDLLPIAAASNLVFGGNPLYQISDFLAFYPKFGNYPQAIATYTFSGTMAGYAVNDTLSPVQPDASGAVLTVAAVDDVGNILTAQLTSPGQGFSMANGLETTTSGAGTGALINVTQIAPGNFNVPQAVLQAYINLASAQLSQLRWGALWIIAMGWFIAHYATLYLRSEGSYGSSAGQIASSGLTRGIMVSKSAGGVSATIEVPKGLDDWGAWTQTEYGTQVITQAKVIGMGMIYAW